MRMDSTLSLPKTVWSGTAFRLEEAGETLGGIEVEMLVSYHVFQTEELL